MKLLERQTKEVRQYLDTEIPTTWDDKSIDERIKFYDMPDYTGADKHIMVRRHVSTIEVFVECFGGDRTKMNRHDAKVIREVLRGLKWVGDSSPRIVKMYGSQRVFTRPEYVKIKSKLKSK